MSYPFMRKKNFCPRRSYHVLPIFKNGSFYIGKSKTFIKNFQDIPRTYHSKTLIVNKNFQDIYIFLKFLSKTLLSGPTLISEIEEYIYVFDLKKCTTKKSYLYCIYFMLHHCFNIGSHFCNHRKAVNLFNLSSFRMIFLKK